MTSCLTGGYQKIQMCQIHSVIKGVYTKEEGLQLQQYLPDNKILSVTKNITYVDYGMNCVVYIILVHPPLRHVRLPRLG